MTKSAEYRQKAAECHQQSKKSITALDKRHWLKLAEHPKMAEAVEDGADN
jgi:7-keto-8-aminopelargonate synthetase-like enzyme